VVEVDLAEVVAEEQVAEFLEVVEAVHHKPHSLQTLQVKTA
jgi:hypothetical protein